MVYKANCKINIGLSVINKREDGFHNLSTIMYPVDGLYDLIEIVNSDKFMFSSSGLEIDCSADNNLCVKAYNLLKREYPQLAPLHIHLHKITPFGAGLGGGSSDATTVLKGITEFAKLEITEQRLIELSAEIGSDTPFFVKNRAQLCSGRGEIMEDIDIDLSKYHITIVKPHFSISTKEAFAAIKPKPAQFDLAELPTIDIEEWRNCLVNDFENGLFELYPILFDIKQELYSQGAIYASMSGSGTAIYAISYHKVSLSDRFDNEKFSIFYS